MPSPESIPVSAWAIYALLISLGLYVYGCAVRHIARHGGKVRTDGLEMPELLMSFVLVVTFVVMIGATIGQTMEKKVVKIDNVLPGSLFYVILGVGIFCFLYYVRRLQVSHIFGLDRTHSLTAIGWAVGLCLAALPLAGSANFLTTLLLKDKLVLQPLVELFSQVARQNDYAAMAKIFVAGVIFAPCCEEFLFRGLFYGVWKRYTGPIAAGFLASLLFAAMHASVAAFGGLFVLAVCLNIAYERTGSLLVPIGLHATFNFISLLTLYVRAMPTAPVVAP